MSEKVSARFLKALKENKNKKGILSVIKIKLQNIEETFKVSKQKMIDSGGWVVKKIDATSAYGPYRIIVAKSSDNNIVYDFYFKNQKEDLLKSEIDLIREFLVDCEDEDFLSSLKDFSELE